MAATNGRKTEEEEVDGAGAAAPPHSIWAPFRHPKYVVAPFPVATRTQVAARWVVAEAHAQGRRRAQEDATVVRMPGALSPYLLAAVCDGHGGPDVSAALTQLLPSSLFALQQRHELTYV